MMPWENRQPDESASHRYVSIGGIPAVDAPVDDQEAKEVLSIAYQTVFGVDEADVNLFALGISQAIGLMEGVMVGVFITIGAR